MERQFPCHETFRHLGIRSRAACPAYEGIETGSSNNLTAALVSKSRGLPRL